MHAVKPRQSIRVEELEHGMVGTPGGHWPAAGLTSAALPARTSAVVVTDSHPVWSNYLNSSFCR
jgi:hypothetical protein